MKRAQLKRKTSLQRTRGPRVNTAKRAARRLEPGRDEWKQPYRGLCDACDKPGLCIRHHVVYEQHVRAAHGDPWDLRDAMGVGIRCDCHQDHHHKGRLPDGTDHRIRLVKLPDDAIDFAFELYGAWAYEYLTRRYQGPDPRVEAAHVFA